jgi:hypothetical protein
MARQWLSVQEACAGHANPQLPQLLESFEASTHADPHIWPHWHCPPLQIWPGSFCPHIWSLRGSSSTMPSQSLSLPSHTSVEAPQVQNDPEQVHPGMQSLSVVHASVQKFETQAPLVPQSESAVHDWPTLFRGAGWHALSAQTRSVRHIAAAQQGWRRAPHWLPPGSGNPASVTAPGCG